MNFTDAQLVLGQDGLGGRWRDRKIQRHQDYLDEKYRLAENDRTGAPRARGAAKAEEYAVYQKFVAPTDFMERNTIRESNEAHDHFIAEFKSFIATTRKDFDWAALQKKILHLQLFTQDDKAEDEMREGDHQP